MSVEYTPGPGRGLGPNRNHALRLVTEDTVLFLDDDCRLGPEFLARTLDCMRAGEVRHGAGRVIVTGMEANRGGLICAAAQTFLGFQSRPYRDGEAMTSIVINACLFPRSLFDLHTFEERIRYGYEEVDLASRAVAAGYTIVPCNAAVNDHHPSPHGRDDYEDVMVAARLFVTFKRYAFTDHRYALACAYLVFAPLHAVLAALKARGAAGGLQGVRAVALAARYLRAYRQDPTGIGRSQ